MKNSVCGFSIRKLAAAVLTASVALAVTACSSAAGASSASAPGSQAAAGSSLKAVKIGVIQYAPNPSLDNCYTGFKKGLEESGYKEGENLTIDFQDAQGDPSNSDMIAKNMVSKKYDMIMAIATPAAMSAYGAAKLTDIPVVFTAISDPVAAGLVQSNEKPGFNCTGSSDVLPLEQQLQMIRAFLPDAKKIGVLYTTSEPNSISNLKRFQELAPKYNFEIVDVGVTNASEVAAGAASLVSKGIDCINNFTDNNVVNNLSSVLQAANQAKIPIFGSEVEQVKNGCLASVSIDFVSLGEETGKMAAKILGGAKAAEMPVYVVDKGLPVYSQAVLGQFGLKLPAEYASAEAVSK